MWKLASWDMGGTHTPLLPIDTRTPRKDPGSLLVTLVNLAASSVVSVRATCEEHTSVPDHSHRG